MEGVTTGTAETQATAVHGGETEEDRRALGSSRIGEEQYKQMGSNGLLYLMQVEGATSDAWNASGCAAHLCSGPAAAVAPLALSCR